MTSREAIALGRGRALGALEIAQFSLVFAQQQRDLLSDDERLELYRAVEIVAGIQQRVRESM